MNYDVHMNYDNFQKYLKFKKVWNFRWGGWGRGSSLFGNFSQIFPFFFYDGSPKMFIWTIMFIWTMMFIWTEMFIWTKMFIWSKMFIWTKMFILNFHLYLSNSPHWMLDAAESFYYFCSWVGWLGGWVGGWRIGE